MTLETVKARRSVYEALVAVYYAALNGEIDLEHPAQSPVPPFPKDEPDEWGIWAAAARFHIRAETQFQITDEAFKKIADMMIASELVAAKIRVPEPSADDVAKIEQGLEKINKEVKADQRFHAALDIG